MRIALSGTHGSGKSTLAADFAAAHPDYIHEPEPYEWLAEMYGESFADEPSADDFHRQLELSVERLRTYDRGARVIAERSPLDFLAYLRALDDRDGFDSAIDLAARGLAHLDLIVFLPLNARDRIVIPDAEDLELREAVNERLADLLTNDELDLLRGRVAVLEVRGTPAERLAALERAVGSA